jgi:hypothetical protein
MNETPPIVRLDLRAPLLYTETPELNAFNCPSSDALEFIFCFELDQEQAQSIEPQPEKFLGQQILSGKNDQNLNSGPKNMELPAGLYLFTQRRGLTSRKECITMAIEQQKDGLWEKIKLENRLFLRFLYEDNSPVTQLFRPCLP